MASSLLLLALVRAAPAAPLSVDSAPPGATVFLDDRFLGVTPLALEVSAEGRHLLRLQKRGYRPWRGVIDFAAGPTPVAAELQPETLGRLTVTTDPPGADLLLDARPAGKTPAQLDALDLGPHVVHVSRNGYAPASREVLLTLEAPEAALSLTLQARVEEYLLAQLAAHPEDVMSAADLAHEYALEHRFDECLDVLGRGFDEVARLGDQLDQDAIRRLYMEIDRLWEKQFDYASDDVVAALRPRLIECLKAATARHPRNGHTYEALADLLAHQGDAAGSLAAYQEGAAQAESLPSRIRLLGEAGSTLYAAGTQAEKAEQWQAAADAYEKVAQTYPDLWCAQNALQRLVEVHGERLSDPQNALGAARRLEAQFPQDSDVPQTLSRAAAMLARADQAEPAVALTEELAAKYPSYRNLPDALIRAANIARKSLDQPDRALALLQKAIEAAGSRAEGAEARYDMARFLKAQGRQAEYDALAQEILRLYPYSSYAIALSTNPQQRESAQAAAKAFQQAYELVKADRNAEAVPALEAVVAQHPDTYHACVAQSVVATTYAKMQEPEKAVQAAQQFAERWPTHAEAPSNLYRAAAWMASPIGDVPRALAAYEAIVDQYPGDYYAELALYQTAQLRMQSSTALDYKESISCFERLLAEYSGSLYVGIAAKYIADCRMQLRDTEGARQGYLRIMAEAPNSYTAYLAARSFQTVRMRKEDAEQPAAR